MTKVEKEAKKQGLSINELILETEQKILDNEYIINDHIEYGGEKLSFQAHIITQREFNKINNILKDDGAEANGKILKKFLINPKDKKNFTQEQIDNLPAGLVASLSLKIMDLSGFNLDNLKKRETVGF